jgi:hypothetical protein
LGKLWNPVLKMLLKLTFSTTPRPDHEPWRMMAKRVENLDIEEYFMGLMFLASGFVAEVRGRGNAGSASKQLPGLRRDPGTAGTAGLPERRRPTVGSGSTSGDRATTK